jgi:hypothetical protein
MNVITEPEVERLKSLEGVIGRGKKAFIEVGLALREIRDSRLYKVKYKTFDAYVQERWDFSRIRAHQLIDAAEVVENVKNFKQNDSAPAKESHAFQLAKLPAEEQAEVWEEVTRTTATPTAKVIQGVVEKRIEAKQAKADQSRPSTKVATPKAQEPQSEKRPPKTERQFFVEARALFDAMDEFHRQKTLELWSEWLLTPVQ